MSIIGNKEIFSLLPALFRLTNPLIHFMLLTSLALRLFFYSENLVFCGVNLRV